MLGWAFLNTDTGVMVPARCGRNGCAYCLRSNAKRRAAAIAYAAPERALLLTQVGDDWQQVRDRMKKLRYRVAQEVGAFHWVWHVEPNPAGTGHHVHAWQHGSFVPQARLSALAGRSGMGEFARINRIRSQQGAAQYGLKGLGYGLKATAGTDEQGLTYLIENGSRLTHQSRSFFRSAQGEKLPVRVAEKLALASEGSGSWVLVREESAQRETCPA